MRIASIVETARDTPGAAGRIVRFGQKGIATATACNKDIAVEQQGRSVRNASEVVEAPRVSPCPGRRIVQLRARGIAVGVTPSCK